MVYEKTEVLGRKHIPKSLYPTEVPHVVWD